MSEQFAKMKDITADLLSGDVSVKTKLNGGDNTYNMIPCGIMVVKDSAADEVTEVKVGLRGGGEGVVLYLKINVLYPIPVDKVFKTGSTTETIVIFGHIN